MIKHIFRKCQIYLRFATEKKCSLALYSGCHACFATNLLFNRKCRNANEFGLTIGVEYAF